MIGVLIIAGILSAFTPTLRNLAKASRKLLGKGPIIPCLAKRYKR